MTTSVAVALVTRNAAPWVDGLAASIQAQTQAPGAIVIVDDHSTDDTRARIREAFGSTAEVIPSLSTASRRIDRIADNFSQAVRACSGFDVVILGDHDDVWLPDRIAHQAGCLGALPPTALMIASDGVLVDERGDPLGGTLRTNFRLPGTLGDDPRTILRLALTHLVATGGASAIRPSEYPSLAVPPGWLHDRWWSLVAAARGGLMIDDQPVIHYRVHRGQEAGLDRASHGSGPRGKLLRVGPLTAARKLHDFRRFLVPLADGDALADELRLLALAKTMGFLPAGDRARWA